MVERVGEALRRSWSTCRVAIAIVFVLYACVEGPTEGEAGWIACAARPNRSPGPVPDPTGPYHSQVLVGNSPDGRTLLNARAVIDHAAVPDGVRLDDGRVFIYYVDGTRGSLAAATLTGAGAERVGAIVVDGERDPLGFSDPDALLVSGRARLFYVHSSLAGVPEERSICVAESSDGVHFSTIGVALDVPAAGMSDPSVAQLPDGSWLMAISTGQRIVTARSSDGLHFIKDIVDEYGGGPDGGVPELARTADGGVRMYVCEDGEGIVSYVSLNGGHSFAPRYTRASWQREGVVVLQGSSRVCDPSSVAGTSWFIYKAGR